MLTQCVEMRAQETILDTALRLNDARILHLVQNHDLIAAEAHYHVTCYKSFTRNRPDKPKSAEKDEEEDEYCTKEAIAIEELFRYIRNEVIAKEQVTTLVDLTSKLTQFLREAGLQKIRDSTKKHLRRTLESEFRSAIRMFPNENCRIIFLPVNVSATKLASEIVELKQELKQYRVESEKSSKLAKDAAVLLRSEAKSFQSPLAWPPLVSQLQSDNFLLPKHLNIFVTTLLGTSEDKVFPPKTVSLGQDILYMVSKGKCLTPKHVLLPFTVKSLTGNVELVKILNRLGHGVSYSKTLEIDTAFALQKLATQSMRGFVLPEKIYPHVQVSLVYDNIDRLEETLSGADTSHRVNGIVIQKKVIGSEPELVTGGAAAERTHQRSLSVEKLELPAYNAGVRPEPPTVFPSTNVDGENSRKLAWLKNMLWVIARIANQQRQTISSWTGFNIQARSNVSVVKDTVGYLPTIDAPATSMSTVYEVLCQAVRIKEALSLESIVVIFDQAMYAKGVEIAWKHANMFKSVVIRLGAFHTACTLLAIIGKRFGDAGLRDICIESSVIAEGSVNGVLGGKQYNRAVRFHKLMYESCMRLIWEGFLSWIQACDESKRETLQQFLSSADNVWKDGMDIEMLQSLLDSESLAHVDTLFQQYMDVLRHQNGTMSQFWMTYIDLVTILLDFIRASREGDWALHLKSIGEIIPWCFAYDRTNYARYLPWYLRNMTSLSTTHPDVDEYLKAGGFSTQMSDRNTFGRIPMDQTIEETVNKDTQTPGGTKGFSLRKGESNQNSQLSCTFQSNFATFQIYVSDPMHILSLVVLLSIELHEKQDTSIETSDIQKRE